jgi:alpha-tubulin suppressor-like RCC1 family protein
MPTNNFRTPEGDLENQTYITESWLVDQWIGDQLWTWGYNLYGQLGINNIVVTKSTPVTTLAGGTNWKQVDGGLGHSAAIKTDGTLWLWGDNSNGQLGINLSGVNPNAARSTPVTTFAGGTNWKQVSCGNYHTAAIKTDGTLWMWGSNSVGQLGINLFPAAPNSARSTPVTTFAGGNNWKQVVCSSDHTAAIKTDGTLWTWGSGDFGQLGDNTVTQRLTPITTFAGGTNWKQVAGNTGAYHVAAIKTDGTLWTWGTNISGELGTNDNLYRSIPVQVFGNTNDWKQVAVSRDQTAAIKTNGTLWTWGDNTVNRAGSIGDNTIIGRSTPVTTFAGGNNWKQVACGYSFKSAIKTDGTLWSWGGDYYSQLGTINPTSYRPTPVTTFAGGNNWRQVACGYEFAMAVTSGPDY